jgi:hypothetical protein
MTAVRLRIGMALCVFLLQATLAPVAMAQDTMTHACFGEVYRLMDREQRLYRSVLFGQKAAEELPVGSVRTDAQFQTWMKTAENRWESLAPGFEEMTWSDQLMDEQADVPVRRGLMEQRRTPTSDLLPPLLQSYRALQCRLRAVCGLSRASRAPSDGLSPLVIETDGCLAVSFRPLPQCVPASILESGFGSCDDAVAGIMEREGRLLHLLVAYDAAYRSLLQFGGAFEGFLRDVQLPLLQPLWQAVRVLGSLDNLPCFLSQCDE